MQNKIKRLGLLISFLFILGIILLAFIIDRSVNLTGYVVVDEVRVSTEKLDSALIEDIQAGNYQPKVVVILEDNPTTLSADLDEKKKAIEDVQEEVLVDLKQKVKVVDLVENAELQIGEDESEPGVIGAEADSAADFELTHKFMTINAISGNINAPEALAELTKNKKIKKILLDYPVEIVLDQSVPQINADDAWTITVEGTNITGAGETVCIIDTGIDYTHSALGGCQPVTYLLEGNIENLTSLVESAHPYDNDFDYTWTITKPGYEQIAVHFINISLENMGAYDTLDRVYVYDQNNNTLAVYKQDLVDVWSPYGVGDTIYVRLVTDGSVLDDGFYIDQVINGTTNTTMNWSSCSKVIGGWDVYNNDYNPQDDHGHGTHVAGIVASVNETYRGVAPEAKLVAIKALSSGGSGYSSDIAAGIDWCASNAQRLNISVISMSLGGSSRYQTYCNNDLTAGPINVASGLNVTVAISSGNSGWTNGISNPACVENATPIGGVNANDGIVYNRGLLLDLLAPATSIQSAHLSNAWVSWSGTSMATPHFSGAVTLLRQYWKLAYGKVPTSTQVENKFALTGKLVDDATGSGLNFSRINILAALQPYLNFTASSVANNIIIEINSSLINNSALVNISSDLVLSTALLELDHLNGTNRTLMNYTMNTESQNDHGVSYYSYLLTNLTAGNYTYRVYGNDSVNNFGLSVLRTLYVNQDTVNETPANQTSTNISIVFNAPLNNSYFNQQFNLNVTVSGQQLSVVSYNITDSLGTVVQSSINDSLNNSSNSNFTWTDLVNVSSNSFNDNNYTLIIVANDSSGTLATASVNFVVDKTPPALFGFELSPNTVYNDHDVIFSVNVTDLNLNISAIVVEGNWAGSENTSVLTNYTLSLETGNQFSFNVSQGNFSNQETVTYKFYASDNLGNLNSSEIFNFTVENRAPNFVNVTVPLSGIVIEVGEEISFSSTATDPDGDNLTYSWNFNDGTGLISGDNVSHLFNSTGNLTVVLSVSDDYGAGNSTDIVVVVNDTPRPNITAITYSDSLHLESDLNQTVSAVIDRANISSTKLYFNENVVELSSQSGNSYTWNWGNFSSDGEVNFLIETIDDYNPENSLNFTYYFNITSCSDLLENGDETGLDCGGSCDTACEENNSDSEESSDSAAVSSSAGGGGGGGGGAGNAAAGADNSESSATEISETVITALPFSDNEENPAESASGQKNSEEEKALPVTAKGDEKAKNNKSKFNLIGMTVGFLKDLKLTERDWKLREMVLLGIFGFIFCLLFVYFVFLRE